MIIIVISSQKHGVFGGRGGRAKGINQQNPKKKKEKKRTRPPKKLFSPAKITMAPAIRYVPR